MLVGRHEWLVEFDKLRLPYNINVLTQESAKFALDNVDVLNKQTALLRASRSELYTALGKIPFVHPYQSEANFILVRLDRAPARTVFAQLKEKGILIKCLDGAHPLLANCLRITVGTAQENAAFLSAFETILKSHHSSE